MKIANIRIDVIRREVPYTKLQPPLGGFGGEVDQGLLRVLTDDGTEGNCVVGQFRGEGGPPLFEPILKLLKPLLIGRDAADREWLWRQLYMLDGCGGYTQPAWATVDVALWDIAGKAAGMPIHRLLGTSRPAIDVYATYPPRHQTPDGYVGEAEELLTQGYRAYKIHPGHMSTGNVIETVGRVRSTVGDGYPLMLDPNNGYDLERALEIGHALDDNGFFWFEDPVPWDDSDAVRELSKSLSTPICMSDAPGFLLREAAHYVRHGTVKLPRGTAKKIGITGLKKLCSMCEAFGLNCEIGTAGNPTLDAANLHVMMSIDNCDFFEWWLPSDGRQFGCVEDLALTPESMLDAPSGPGLGLELDEPWIRAHTVETLT